MDKNSPNENSAIHPQKFAFYVHEKSVYLNCNTNYRQPHEKERNFMKTNAVQNGDEDNDQMT